MKHFPSPTDDHVISMPMIERILPIIDRILVQQNPTPHTAPMPSAARQVGGPR
jgi:hypothetical protein